MEELPVNKYEPFPVIASRTLPRIVDHMLFRLKLKNNRTWETFGHQVSSFFSPGFPMKGGNS